MPRFAADPELQDLVATGPALLAQLTAYVHGDVERKDVDGDAMNDWHRRWADRYKEILMAMDEWKGLNPFAVSRMVLAGERAQATVIYVRDTGVTFNEDPLCRAGAARRARGSPVIRGQAQARGLPHQVPTRGGAARGLPISTMSRFARPMSQTSNRPRAPQIPIWWKASPASTSCTAAAR